MGLKKVLSPNRKKKYVVVGKKDQLPTADAELGSTASTGELPAPPQNGPLPTKPPEQEKSLTVGDNVFLQLFVVIACAMFFRRLWMLHGITILFLRRMLILGLRWFDFFMDTGVFHEIMSITGYIFRFAFKNTEKVLQGDSLRMFFAASWLQVRKPSIRFFCSCLFWQT